jgi:hypothetical protein
MKAALIFGTVFLVIVAFSVSLSLAIADAAGRHDWLGLTFWLFILVIGLGAFGYATYYHLQGCKEQSQ